MSTNKNTQKDVDKRKAAMLALIRAAKILGKSPREVAIEINKKLK